MAVNHGYACDADTKTAQKPTEQAPLKAFTRFVRAGADIDPDEAFAKQLQQQLDMEDGYYQHHQEAAAAPAQPAAPYRTPATSVAQDLAHSLFAFDRQQEDEGDHRRGRGRGRGGRRGDRGRGRRVHHNVQHVPLS